jgi:hypothetical protein
VNYLERLGVRPGSRVELSDIDPAFKDHHESHEDAAEEIEQYRKRLCELQDLLYADRRQSLLICLQAMGTGGKDGTINHFLSAMNPQGCRVTPFKQPSAEEAAHDLLTGDGVNDAPALKKADCGIAVSGATDAARAAASIVLMTPGLSVINDAIKESRKIFQRMNSYAIYRIAETLRVLLFMTLAILIFNFYPLTAVMIVMLALLNDGAILSIAYDRVHYMDKPEAWSAHGSWGLHGHGRDRSGGGVCAILFRRARLSPRSRAHPDSDVSEAVRGRASDDLPDTHARSVLVDAPGSDLVAGGVRDAIDRDSDRRVRCVHDTARLGLGAAPVGLRAGVVCRERSRQNVCLSIIRPDSRAGHGEAASWIGS